MVAAEAESNPNPPFDVHQLIRIMAELNFSDAIIAVLDLLVSIRCRQGGWWSRLPITWKSGERWEVVPLLGAPDRRADVELVFLFFFACFFAWRCAPSPVSLREFRTNPTTFTLPFPFPPTRSLVLPLRRWDRPWSTRSPARRQLR